MSDRDGIDDLRKVGGDVIVLNVTRSSKEQARYSTLECPMISPVEEPESNMNAWPNLFNQKEDGVVGGAALTNVLEAHALFFPIADGDDALAFAIPLEVIAVFLFFCIERK